MAIALISSPTSPDGAYRKGAGVFNYKNELSVTGTANSSGDLQLTVTGIGALVEVGDYLYYDQLANADNVDTPVVEVKAEATNTVTLDTPYSASYSGGVVRLMKAEEFKVLTGYTSTAAQPRRTSQVLNVYPDAEGIYSVGVLPAVKTRFNFGEPDTSTDSDYHHQVSAVAYPTAISAPSDIVLLKQNVTSGPVLPICYSNFRGLISAVESSIYKVYIESPKQESLVEGAVVKIVRYFVGQTIDILLDTPQAGPDMIATPGLPTGVSWITSGINYIGIRIAATATTAANGTLTLNNTSSGDSWQVNIQLYNCQEVREQCTEKELTLVWWNPGGGWSVYSFELLRTLSIDGNDATVVKDSAGVRSAVDFDNLVEAVELRAYPEGEAVRDILNTLNYSSQVYIASFTGSGTSRAIDTFTPCFVGGGGFGLKSQAPYKALDNQFSITIYKGEEVRAVVQ
jgi:hypothetical protein